MKVAAITKFRHGMLFEAMTKLAWTQCELAERSGCSLTTINSIYTLKKRPAPQLAERIERAFLDAGYDFDSKEAWPLTFKGFPTSVTSAQVKDVGQLEMDAAIGFTEARMLNEPVDEEVAAAIMGAVEMLKPQEVSVLKKRFGLDGESKPMSQKEIADEMHLNDGRIGQIEKAALRRLRHPAMLKIIGIEP